MDRTVGGLLLVLCAPVLVVVLAGTRLFLGRGVLYSQLRVGRHGRPFRIYKVRTMRPDRREPEPGADGYP
ncbi:MAG: sugar transferase, partial [Acidimicrobiia bacterium]|nr:sugar transferase [Acidimicrobiia bacterium]